MINGGGLRKFREKQGLSSQEFADLLRVPEPYIQDIENNIKTVNPKVISRIAETFEIDKDDFSMEECHSELTLYLGDQIRALREEKQLSLERLGSLTGLSVTYLSEIERKQAVPSLSTLKRIANVFNVPVSLFIGNTRKCSLVVEKLKRARKNRGMSQKQLAEKAGVSPGLIGQLETGKAQASIRTLEKITKALGVSVCSVILEQEDIEEVIGALSPELRSLLYQPNVQAILGSTCTMEPDKLKLVLNFIDMLNSPKVE